MGTETDVVTSLAYNGDLSQCAPDPDKLDRCPRKKGMVLLSLSSGTLIPARCGANFCPYCCRQNAALIARAMAMSEPSRMIRLSLVPAEWKRTQSGMQSLMKWARRNYGKVELAYHVEPNPRGTGNHIHAWQHGPNYIPQSELQRACERIGWGQPDIRKWRNRGGRVGYGLKGIGYGMKADDVETFLGLNGGRLVHASRGFYRDGADGQRLTLQEAKERVVERFTDRDGGPWVLRTDPAVIRRHRP